MKKLLLMLLLVFTVVSCELEEAQKAYDRKEYFTSMGITLDYFQRNPKKLEKINSKVKDEIMEKFSDIVDYYNSAYAEGSTVSEKIEGLNELLKIHMLLSKYNFSNQFTDFRNTHNMDAMFDKYKGLVSSEFQKEFDSGNYEEAEKVSIDLFDNL